MYLLQPWTDIATQVRDGKAVYHVRAALLAAGFPNTTAASCVNRFCSSSLQATQNIANEIASGAIDIGLAVGAESLSFAGDRLDRPFVDEILEASQDARDCMQSMGQTSENVASDFNVTRELQDLYSAETYKRAEIAQRKGWFDDEIVPITVKRDGKEVTLTRDEGPRWGTTYEKLSKLRPSFTDYGDRSTAGNSSQITDGAAAILLMKRSKALELKQPILAKYVGATVAGLAPRIMGIGPVFAIPKLLGKYNLSLSDIDLIEINEAFASMAVYCRDELKIDWNKLNARGGAIALGHPFGCTGVRQIVTGLSECRRRRVRLLVTSMCLGTGMGMAGLFVNEQNVEIEKPRL
jgi:acetyl-CoA acyltransferase 1